MDDQEFTKEETDRRALANLKRMIATPPRPRKARQAATKAARAPCAKPGKRGRAASES